MKSESLPSNIDRRFYPCDIFILAGMVTFSLAIYLAASAVSYRIGFPLDDSWIHQTYARNLALRAEWSFLPGQPSAGSTSPLWTALLSIGYLIGLSPYIWTYFLGGLCLFGVSLLAERIVRLTVRNYSPAIPWVGLIFIFEWHLAWAAFSGMETILYIFIVLLAMRLLLTNSRNHLAAGMVAGVSIWVRPDGLTLLVPLGLAALLMNANLMNRVRALLLLLLGFGIFFFPYILFNLVISDMPMPNTFYAKQAEYAAWQSSPLAERMLLGTIQFFMGLTVLLIPGFVQNIISGVRQRAWGVLLAVSWTIGYTFLYILRLPVYQHGRYFMPAMAVFLLLSIPNFLQVFLPGSSIKIGFASKVMLVIVCLVFVASVGLGVVTYAQDVDLIERQMVDTAKWVAQNVPQGALIAAHDIGALGYFDNHPLVDLAGLISPEVIPFITDERGLADYMNERNVQYLVAFSGWRPALTTRGTRIYETYGGNNNIRDGLGRMAVYLWQQP